jgi:hypothetical protein
LSTFFFEKGESYENRRRIYLVLWESYHSPLPFLIYEEQTMHLYLCSVEEDIPFDPHIHCCTNYSIFSFDMRQKEGEIAVVRVEVRMSDLAHLTGRWVWVSVINGKEVTPLFKGIGTTAIEYPSDQTAILTFWALPKMWSEQVAEITKSLSRCAIAFHEDRLLTVLEDRPYLWHFDPVTHQVSLSDVFKGRQTHVFDRHILAGSFKQRHHCQPYQSIDVEVVAEWIQQAEGEFNLFPLIANQFPEQKLNTLTPDALLRSWPREGNWLKRSGYYVTKSQLLAVEPPITGGLDMYPRLTKAIEIAGKWQRFRRYWFEGELRIAWQYRQKRRQRLRFTVEHRHHHLTSSWGQRKKLTLHVRDVETHLKTADSDDFFGTEQGYQAFDKALHRAYCHLAGSARTLRLEFWVPFCGGLSLDSTVEVLCPGTQQRITGKLLAYRHCLNERTWMTEVKVGVALGLGEGDDPIDCVFEALAPSQGLTDFSHRTIHDFVERIQIEAPSEQQWQAIQESESLSVPGTVIQIQLKDLRSKDFLEQVLNVKERLSWSPPRPDLWEE